MILFLVIAAFAGAAVAYPSFAAPTRTKASNAEKRITEVEEEAGKERAAREALAIEKAAVAATADRVVLST
ncbi:MAG: hypothetical protein ACE1Z4_06175 [Gammaproteobacteria bacterium]